MSDLIQEIIVYAVIAAAVIWCVWRVFRPRPKGSSPCCGCAARNQCFKKDDNHTGASTPCDKSTKP